MKQVIKLLLIISIIQIINQTTIAQIEDWVKLNPFDEEFSADIPSENFNKFKSDFKNDAIQRNSYNSYSNKTYFKISTANYRQFGLLGAVRKYALDNNAKKSALQKTNLKGEYYRFEDQDAYFNTVAIFSTENKHYVFHICSESSNYADADRLINSIKFAESAKNGTPNPLPKIKPLPVKTDAKPIKRKILSGSGSSRNKSNANNNVRKVDPSKAKNKSTPIKILKKVKPGYTELARSYNISGQVRMKVIFYSDGTIGNITPMQKLPFGLTNQAKIAARKIKFDPPHRNGVPFSVVKMVVYNFRIY